MFKELLAWRAQIQAFLAERLRLSLTDPVAKPQLIKTFQGIGYMLDIPGEGGESAGDEDEITEDEDLEVMT